MQVPIAQVHPNPSNPRFIKDDKYKALVQSIKDFPEMAEARPIVVNKEHMILGGNMRYRAMKEAGYTFVAIKVVDWSEAKQREFIAKDNIGFGEWDWELLANEWDAEELTSWGLDLPASFGSDEVEEDEAPAVSEDPPVSKLGEIYQLGKHRLMCGDSTDFGAVSDLMNGKQADMVFTDPPYGVSYEEGLVDKDSRMKAHRSITRENTQIENDTIKDDEGLYNFLLDAFKNLSYFTKHGIYVCFASNRTMPFMRAWKDADLYHASTIIWAKDRLVMGRGHYHYQYEPILYGWKKKSTGKWMGDRSQSNLWNLNRPTVNDVHPTMKPIELVTKALNNSSGSEDIVLDLFLGSGSTLIACEQTDRICYGMELDPRYCDVIRRRYWKFVNNGDETGWEENTPLITG